MKIAGWILSLLIAALLSMSIYFKFFPPPEALEVNAKMGLGPDIIKTIGMIELVVTLLFLLPPTTVLGAILLTGYFGGAIMVHIMMKESCLVQVIIPIVIWFGAALRKPEIFRLVWGGLIPVLNKKERTPSDS